MAIKKNELYSSLWASCDKLRGGMDASQYKDYILTLLFVKYVTDKFKGVKYADITVPEGGSFDDLVALKGDKNIGEKMDKVIAKLAEAGNNNLRGVIDNAHFNDEAKLGTGKEMVDKLTGLISIFQRPEFNFANNARVLIVTDREELDDQIEKLYKGVDEDIKRTKSGKDLLERLNSYDDRLLCSLVHKFGRRGGESTESDYEKYIDDLKKSLPKDFCSKGDIVVFVDECHRTQSGKLHEAMA